jgi:phosphoenolpyruvate-protein phosphotransferase (PTS system enzyme I)
MKKDQNKLMHGIASAPGIAIAQAYIYMKDSEVINQSPVPDVEDAIKNLQDALAKSKKELNKIFGLAIDKLGEKRAAIFEAQLMILDDPILIATIIERIYDEKKNPEYIVDDEISKYQLLMSRSHEPYMKERSLDIEDIKNRIVRNLKKKKWKSQIENDVIVVAHSITPSDTVLFSRVNVKAYVTDLGGLTSHASIVARSLNIPAVVGLHDASNLIENGDIIIVDGFHGQVIINPTEEDIIRYQDKNDRLSKVDVELLKLKDEPAVTLDGKELKLMANLDLHEEVELIFQHGARGVGLVRTEQLFDDSESFPEEEEQYLYYKNISEKIYPETVIIRAFDIGGDKVLPVDLKEPNPFLGWRGIRLLLDNPNLFRTQIKAVLRSSVNKNVKFMIPMVTELAEIRKFKWLLEECKIELKKEGKHFDKGMKIGVMIEIPSAAVMAKEFAEEVDFLSIGTNDLIQYLLAVDRGNEIVSNLYQEFHPAVIRMLSYIIKEGKKARVMVSLCGEMSSDPVAIPLLIGMGLDCLSMSVSAIPTIKKIIRNISYKECHALAEQCLTLQTELEVNNKLHIFFTNNILSSSGDFLGEIQ